MEKLRLWSLPDVLLIAWLLAGAYTAASLFEAQLAVQQVIVRM